jgi:hypothetical protein
VPAKSKLALLALFLRAFANPDVRSAAVFVDEFGAGQLQGGVFSPTNWVRFAKSARAHCPRPLELLLPTL